MFYAPYFDGEYFSPVWFAPGDESHLTPEEIRPTGGFIGGRSVLFLPKIGPLHPDYGKSPVKQSTEQKPEDSAEKLAIAKEVEHVRRVKETQQEETPDYWALHIYEYLLAEQLAKIAAAEAIRKAQEDDMAFVFMMMAEA